MDPRAVIVAIIAVAAMAGVALAAESQTESFLHKKDLETGFSERDSVSGNLVALTGFLLAFAFALAALLMSPKDWRRRLVGIPVVLIAAYVLILMTQTGMFRYVAEDAARSAVFSISPLVGNGIATPSIFIGPLAVMLVAALGMQQAMRHMHGHAVDPMDRAAALRRFIAAIVIATPFVGATVFGNLRLLVALPHDDAATLPYLIVLPLASLAAAAMLVVGSIKAYQLARAIHDPRFAVVAKEAWEGTRRAEWAILGVIAGVSLLASILEGLRSDVVQAGSFNLNVRTHSQAQILLLLVFMPWMGQHRSVVSLLGRPGEAAPSAMAPVVAYWVVAGVGGLAAAIATFTLGGALWAWLMLAVPLAILAMVVTGPRDALIPALMAALILWGIGNTVDGFFQLNTTDRIEWAMQPGLLALWRTCAVVLVAVAVARSARDALPGVPRAFAWPMTAGLGAAVAIVIFLQLPFSAWIIHQGGSEHVGIGTVIASQDPSVRGVLHGISMVAGFLAGLAIARLHRPDWFGRRARPSPVAYHAGAPSE